MIKLGITGTTTFENRRKIKNMIFTIKQNLGDEVMFVGIGDKVGADRHIRRYVLKTSFYATTPLLGTWIS